MSKFNNISEALFPKIGKHIDVWALFTSVDHRGISFEAFRSDRECPGASSIEMAYVSITSPGKSRGPHEHEYQEDYLLFMPGTTFTLSLWDNIASYDEEEKDLDKLIKESHNIDGPTPILVRIPPGIIHGYKNIGTNKGTVINFTDTLYKGLNKREEEDVIKYEAYLEV